VRKLDHRRRALRAACADQQQPRGLAPAQHRGDEVERRVVGPVQVLEYEHDRRRRRDGVERLEHLAQHPRAGRALRAIADGVGRLALAEQPRQLHEPSRRALRQRRHDRVAGRSARKRAERLEHRHVRLAGPALCQALPDSHDGIRGRLVQEGVHERALAGARLAPRQHACAASRQRPPQCVAQPRQLRLPAGGRRGVARGRRRRGRHERRVVLEDAPLERARSRARHQAQLAQAAGKLAVGGERLDLAASAVEREHQRADEILPQRVGGRQAAQLADRLERPAERDQRGGARLLGLGAEVLEPAHLGARELRVGEVAVRGAAPQRERAVEDAQRRGRGEPGGRVHAALEALGVDLVGSDLEPVARAVADQQRRWRATVAAGLEERAQVGHAHGERARRDLPRHAVPRRLQQRVRGHRAAGVQQQAREDRALLRAGRRRAGRGPGHLDRAEDAELHCPTLREPAAAVNGP
jgi:hypothetical protein